MALVIPEGYFQATIPLANSNLQRAAAITFGVSEAETPVPPADFADDVLAAFTQAFGDRIDPNVTIGPVSLFSYGPGGEGGSVVGTGTATGSRSGTNTTPPQVAVIFRKVTGRIGRPGRGRFFLPWAVDRDDVQEDGNISGDELGPLQDAADDFMLGLTAINSEMVLLHNDDVPGSTAPSTVSALRVQQRSGTQGRRNRR